MWESRTWRVTQRALIPTPAFKSTPSSLNHAKEQQETRNVLHRRQAALWPRRRPRGRATPRRRRPRPPRSSGRCRRCAEHRLVRALTRRRARSGVGAALPRAAVAMTARTPGPEPGTTQLSSESLGVTLLA